MAGGSVVAARGRALRDRLPVWAWWLCGIGLILLVLGVVSVVGVFTHRSDDDDDD